MVLLGYRARGSEKLPTGRGALLLVNHQSHLDPLLVGLPLARPVSYLARRSLFENPLLGAIMQRNYVIPIDRESAGASSFREAIRWLKCGFLLGIFPEGTRTRDGSVGRMKPGFVALVRRSGVPVYPVGIAGAHEAMPRGSRLIYPSRVRVVYGDALTDEEIECYTRRGREGDFVALVRERIIACQREAERWRRL